MIKPFQILALLLVLTGCGASKEKTSRVDRLPYYADAHFTPHWFENTAQIPDDFHKIRPFELVNQNGEIVTQADFEGKVYVADFFFTTCPGICPKMTANMVDVQAAFLEDPSVLLLSHSVTPTRDSVEMLRSYADLKGVKDEKWHLVTGDRSLIYELGRRYYFAEENLGLEKSDEDFLHTENFLLVDHAGYLRGIYNGLNKTDVQQLIADIKTLQKEAY